MKWIVLLLLFAFPATAFAWGGDGHQITCLIAEDHLNAKAKAAIHDLLGKDVNISDAEIASHMEVVSCRLSSRGGVRLAMVLNQAIGH